MPFELFWKKVFDAREVRAREIVEALRRARMNAKVEKKGADVWAILVNGATLAVEPEAIEDSLNNLRELARETRIYITAFRADQEKITAELNKFFRGLGSETGLVVSGQKKGNRFEMRVDKKK